MHDVVFKGKRRDTGEWITGSLIVMDDEHVFIMPRYEKATNMTYEQIFGLTVVPVLPETVVQFTGLYDSCGKRVFERDIIKCGFVYCTVKYDAENARFMLYENGTTPIAGFNELTLQLRKVTGNIYDGIGDDDNA